MDKIFFFDDRHQHQNTNIGGQAFEQRGGFFGIDIVDAMHRRAPITGGDIALNFNHELPEHAAIAPALKQDVIQAQQEFVGDLPDSQAAHSPPEESNQPRTGFLHDDEAIKGEAGGGPIGLDVFGPVIVKEKIGLHCGRCGLGKKPWNEFWARATQS